MTRRTSRSRHCDGPEPLEGKSDIARNRHPLSGSGDRQAFAVGRGCPDKMHVAGRHDMGDPSVHRGPSNIHDLRFLAGDARPGGNVIAASRGWVATGQPRANEGAESDFLLARSG